MTNKRNPDLHGNAPDNAPVALLLVDVINDFEFPGGAQLLQHALPAAKRIAALKKRCQRAGIPAVYINDNFGKWRSDFKKLVSHCLKDDVRGEEVVELLKPDRDDYFVLKPKHSGFYSTTLDLLLEHLGAKALILTGFTGDICILFTACDAFLRDYRLLIPSDCVVSEDEKENTAALKYMQRVLEANIGPAADINLRALSETRDAKGQQPNCRRGQHK
ncbi:MAG TPA: isochorismatase family cysteine hydrolase [Pyrinomonadaceae bacterium]|nr:isochorismatase family cysteine hydrolase [Pyrinomonadaceae bacterium]